ncbi:MAG: hypothetical protein AB7G17_11650 [Phycisphaerales bacterium]
MRSVPGHPAHPEQPIPPGGSDPRLNLLLTYSGWQTDSWADRLPQLLEPFGVRSFRAGCAKQAAEIIGGRRIHMAVVDLRLPFDGVCAKEEAGARVLDLLARQQVAPPTVVVKRGKSSREDVRDLHCALRAGVFAAMDPPVTLESILRVMQRILERHYSGMWPGGKPQVLAE